MSNVKSSQETGYLANMMPSLRMNPFLNAMDAKNAKVNTVYISGDEPPSAGKEMIAVAAKGSDANRPITRGALRKFPMINNIKQVIIPAIEIDICFKLVR